MNNLVTEELKPEKPVRNAVRKTVSKFGGHPYLLFTESQSLAIFQRKLMKFLNKLKKQTEMVDFKILKYRDHSEESYRR